MCVHVNIVYVRKEQSRKIETKIERKVEREHMIREMRGQDDKCGESHSHRHRQFHKYDLIISNPNKNLIFRKREKMKTQALFSVHTQPPMTTRCPSSPRIHSNGN